MELDPNWQFPTDLDRRLNECKDKILERYYPLERALQKFALEFSGKISGRTVKEVPIEPIVIFRPMRVTENRSERIAGFVELKRAAARKEIVEAFGRIQYLEDEEPNRAPRLCGFVGVPRRLIQEAKRINTQKDGLREAFNPLSRKQGKVRIRMKGQETFGYELRELTTIALARFGLSKVNLLAAYRHIPYVDQPLESLRFMVIRARTVRRVSIDAVRAHVERSDIDDKTRAKYLARLNRLEPNETLSAPKKSRYDRLRYRAVFKDRSEKGTRLFKEAPAEQPLLVPIANDRVPPDWERPLPPKKRPKVRAQTEANPYLEGFNYYRLTQLERKRRKKKKATQA